MALLDFISKITADKRGSTAVEYAVILAMIVLVVIFAMQGLADETISMWGEVSEKSANAMAGR